MADSPSDILDEWEKQLQEFARRLTHGPHGDQVDAVIFVFTSMMGQQKLERIIFIGPAGEVVIDMVAFVNWAYDAWLTITELILDVLDAILEANVK